MEYDKKIIFKSTIIILSMILFFLVLSQILKKPVIITPYSNEVIYSNFIEMRWLNETRNETTPSQDGFRSQYFLLEETCSGF